MKQKKNRSKTSEFIFKLVGKKKFLQYAFLSHLKWQRLDITQNFKKNSILLTANKDKKKYANSETLNKTNFLKHSHLCG
jgi:hypothetical protein